MLVYEVTMGQVASSSDVVERHLRTFVNGNDVGLTRFHRDTVKAGGLRFHAGDSVRLELRDVDEANNHSEPAVVEFVARDTIAPNAPEGFGATLVAELGEAHNLATVEGHSKVDGKPGDGDKAIAVEVDGKQLPEYEVSRERYRDELKNVLFSDN